jgi:hypothetical protein
MDSTKDFKRTTLPFETPVRISKTSREVLLNNYGNIRAVLDGGIVTIQTKKLKGDEGKVVRRNASNPFD